MARGPTENKASRSTKYPDVVREWRTILARLRRSGVQKTCDHVETLVRSDPYPLTFGLRLIEYLLKRREHNAAGRIIEALERRAVRDPLLDELHSSWLWCMGRRGAALRFALKSARRWPVSYVVHMVGTIYRAMYNRTGFEYQRKKAEQYWRQAHVIVKREEEEDAKPRTGQKP